MPRAEPARQCLYPKSNSGTLQSYKWRFKVLKSTSCLRSYLAMTLSPRLLTKLALGDNCRGLQPSITKSKVNTMKQWQLESRWERIESASDGSASVFSALHIPGVDSALQYNLNFINPPASVYPLSNFSKTTDSISLPSHHRS